MCSKICGQDPITGAWDFNEFDGLQNEDEEEKEELLHEIKFFIDNLLVRNVFIIVMMSWTGLAPWEFEFPFPGSLTSTFL